MSAGGNGHRVNLVFCLRMLFHSTGFDQPPHSMQMTFMDSVHVSVGGNGHRVNLAFCLRMLFHSTGFDQPPHSTQMTVRLERTFWTRVFAGVMWAWSSKCSVGQHGQTISLFWSNFSQRQLAHTILPQGSSTGPSKICVQMLHSRSASVK